MTNKQEHWISRYWTLRVDISLAGIILLITGVCFAWVPASVVVVVINAAAVPVAASFIVLGLLAAYNRRWWTASTSITGATYIGYLIVASIQTLPLREEKAGPKLRVASYNIWVDNLEIEPVVKLIRDTDPDILLILEATNGWVHHLSDSLAKTHPHVLAYPLHHPYGIALFSKHPLEQDTVFLQTNQPPVLASVVKSPIGDLFFVGVHLAQPANPHMLFDRPTDQRNFMYPRLLEWISPYAGHMPVLLAGDFNTVSWDPIYRDFLEQSYLNDSRQGFNATYGAMWPLPLLPIDHILYSDRLHAIRYQREDIPGSDHYGVWADFQPFTTH